MKKSLIVFFTIGFSLFSFSQVLSLPKSKQHRAKPTPEQIKARDERVLKKTGGFINIPASGPAIVVVDTREKSGVAPEQFVSVFTRLSHLKVLKKTVGQGAKNPLDIGRAELQAGAGLVILVSPWGKTNPGLAVFPEERMAIVNSEKVGEGVSFPEAEIRILKEIWRSLGFVTGIGYAPFTNDVMQPCFSLKELDANYFQVIQPMLYSKMLPVFKKLGIQRARKVPYRVAVREGWANAPTNRYQQAVWNEEKLMKSKKQPEKGNVNSSPKKGH